jgi:hypothetical protein
MPAQEAIQRSIAGAWAVMLGRNDGMSRLDLSADGFWDSFWAIPLALPPLMLGWVLSASAMTEIAGTGGEKLSVILRLAIVDVTNWILPLILLGLAARQLGISKRFAPYVVASNWGTLIVVWMGLPVILLSLFSSEASGIAPLFGFVLFMASLLFSWRITRAALNTEVGTTIAVFVGMAVASVLVVILMQPMLGLTPPA